jgi:hypothetical protein
MNLKFEEQPESISKTHIKTTTWCAQPTGHDTFNVVRIKLQDLENMRTGKVNFIGWEKPVLGTLEEKTDVYIVSWLSLDGAGTTHMRPLVGNFNGGFATHREAVQMCEGVWARRAQYRSQIIRPQAPSLLS